MLSWAQRLGRALECSLRGRSMYSIIGEGLQQVFCHQRDWIRQRLVRGWTHYFPLLDQMEMPYCPPSTENRLGSLNWSRKSRQKLHLPH